MMSYIKRDGRFEVMVKQDAVRRIVTMVFSNETLVAVLLSLLVWALFLVAIYSACIYSVF